MEQSDRLLAVAISGPIRAGKTTLAESLLEAVPGQLLRTRRVLAAYPGAPTHRRGLQELGRHLDETTGGLWVVEAAQDLLTEVRSSMIVVDAVRIVRQVEALRTMFRTVHVHLTAPLAILRERWGFALDRPSYDELRSDATEAQVETLAPHANLVIDTGVHSPEETCHATMAFLREQS
jgi:hypothetical protein